jgi:hypothetical protein
MTTTEYRCVLIRPHSCGVLVFPDKGQFRLPRIPIVAAMRAARELQKTIKTVWGLNVFILEVRAASTNVEALAFAELLTSKVTLPFKEIAIGQLLQLGLQEDELDCVESLVQGRSGNSLAQQGWIYAAIAWIESTTGHAFLSPGSIEQWNAGGGFSLFRARSDDGQQYWLKATGKPNAHEFGMTCFLYSLYPDFLPKIVAIKEQWNAWLAEHAGDPLPALPSAAELFSATSRMAKLQLLSIGRTNELLAAGAFDQRLPVLRSHIDRVISFLIEAMTRQVSTKVAPLRANRLLELGEMLRKAFSRQEDLDIPDTLIHNDLNTGNILWDGKNCVFTDWCEVAIGNPFLSCERLCQLNRVHADKIRKVYRECWSERLSMERINEAIVLSPLLAAYACLYGRGDWLNDTRELRLNFESYARSLARHMERAALNPILMEMLCR